MSVLTADGRATPRPAEPLSVLRKAARGAVRVVQPDQHIALRGEGRDTIVGVVTGLLRCFRMTSDGRRHVARFVRPGGLMGLGALVAFRSSVEAVTVSSIVEFRASAVEAACVEDPATRQAIMQAMTAELVARDRLQFRLGRLWADERVADFLLELVEEKPEDGALSARLQMSRADVADYLGVTIETVSRALSRFQREGLIRLHDAHHFTIVRADALSALAMRDGEIAPDHRDDACLFDRAAPASCHRAAVTRLGGSLRQG
ncbi:MAG TPA: helix-turn-helix domain-containing protein [Vitreimonas sp.]|nr:helix-turn-helix domain-containing protein [Vitreimonas sp.]